MTEYIIENEVLKVTIASKGCEIISAINKSTGREYIWDGSPDIWKRHAPILFPLIGRYKNDESSYKNQSYHMTQHGFARDMEFTIVSKSDQDIKMQLCETEETKMKYPFNFSLILGYELEGNIIKASYEVKNTNETEMYFSIGGHPAFAAPFSHMNSQGKPTAAGCELLFEMVESDELGKDSSAFVAEAEKIQYGLLHNGLLMDELYDFPLKDGKVTITEEFFDRDAYIIENYQCNRVSLLEEGKPYVTVEFDAPVFGVWSAAGKGVPFVCIEPWYGRTDRETFVGGLDEREWGNHLGKGELFSRQYKMIFQ